MMSMLDLILQQHFPPQSWSITRPSAGVQKDSYVAHSEQHALFIKFDADTPAWSRLATIGVTPPLLARGSLHGRSYLIQACVDGVHPDRLWFARHAAVLAELIRRYHHDQPLTALLAPSPPQSYADHLRHTLAILTATLAAASFTPFTTSRFQHAWDRFLAQATQLHPMPLVPVHADPSPTNMLVTAQGLTLLDWDEVLLSDPMRDSGVMAWWYLPRRQWQAFFDGCGIPLEPTRLFWWTAQRSLTLAAWLAQRQEHSAAQAFLDDFYRAVQHDPNPQVTG
jgi:hypothetical protein